MLMTNSRTSPPALANTEPELRQGIAKQHDIRAPLALSFFALSEIQQKRHQCTSDRRNGGGRSATSIHPEKETQTG